MNIVSVIVILVFLLIVAITSKKHSNVFLAFGLVDIFLRLINYIGEHTIKELDALVDKIFPDSFPAIIYHYTNGLVADILMWGYILLMVIFFFHVFKYFTKRY